MAWTSEFNAPTDGDVAHDELRHDTTSSLRTDEQEGKVWSGRPSNRVSASPGERATKPTREVRARGRTPQRAQGSQTGSCTRNQSRHAVPETPKATEENARAGKMTRPTKACTEPEQAHQREQQRSGGGQTGNGSGLDVPPHGALGSLALSSATLVASTPTSSSGGSRLGNGSRGASETMCVKERVPFVVRVGRRLRDTRALGGRSGGNGGPRSDSGGLRLCRSSVEGTSNT